MRFANPVTYIGHVLPTVYATSEMYWKSTNRNNKQSTCLNIPPAIKVLNWDCCVSALCNQQRGSKAMARDQDICKKVITQHLRWQETTEHEAHHNSAVHAVHGSPLQLGHWVRFKSKCSMLPWWLAACRIGTIALLLSGHDIAMMYVQWVNILFSHWCIVFTCWCLKLTFAGWSACCQWRTTTLCQVKTEILSQPSWAGMRSLLARCWCDTLLHQIVASQLLLMTRLVSCAEA